MLSKSTVEIIQATAPAVRQHAVAIVEHFYPLLFEKHPGTRAFFNQTHQRDGRQPHALADALVTYAANIDNLGALTEFVTKVAHKHASFAVFPAQYDAVGACLLESIRAVLGEAATDEIIAAWGEAYGVLAKIFIDAEEGIYRANEEGEGGWRGQRTFRVSRKEKESDIITSFYLQPADGGSLLRFQPGQYITFILQLGGEEVRRNYSLSDAPGGNSYRVSIKREPEGLVSNHFHDQVEVGTELEVLPPCGDFVLAPGEKPVVLVAGGVGVTPLMSMWNHAAGSGRRMTLIHACLEPRVQAFAAHVDKLVGDHDSLARVFIYERADDGPLPTGERRAAHTGLITKEILASSLPDDGDVEFYLVGPTPFIRKVYALARELSVPEAQLHSHFFGPLESLAG